MIELGMYIYERLYKQAHPDSFIKVLVQKLLRSTTRSTGSSIYQNKYLKAFAFARQVAQTERVLFANVDASLLKEIKKHERSFPLTSLRLEIALVSHMNWRSETLVQILNPFVARFEAKNDTDWLKTFLAKAAIKFADCGHLEIAGNFRTLRGNQDDHTWTQEVCSHCAEAARSNGERVDSNHGQLILAAFAERIRGNHGDFTDDRRRYRFVGAPHNCYASNDWSPYNNLIDNYHSSRSKGFRPLDSAWFRTRRRAFGCELEIQRSPGYSASVSALAGKAHEVLNPTLMPGEYCYFERDGSIGDGFEIVTQPAGLDIHRVKFDAFLNNAQIKEGMRSHAGGACGFHVHVGRQYLSQAQIYRMQAFLNDPKNKALITKIARRYSTGSGYAKFKPELSSLSVANKNTHDRYDALNVTNTDTVEFRIFCGSLRYESIMAALEFVNALVEFCMPGQIPLNEFNAIGFRRYINRPENEEDTMFLRAYTHENATDDTEQRIHLAA